MWIFCLGAEIENENNKEMPVAGENIEVMAQALFEARRDLKQIAPLRKTMDLSSVEAAQAVQETTTQLWLSEGRRLVGRKIGLTAKAVQQQMGVNEPDYGVLWADYAFSEGETVDIRRFMQPRAEAEIAFVMENDITDPLAGMQDVIRATAYCVPAVEIVDSAIADWDIQLVDTIADNASGGGFALGTSPRRITDIDMRLCGMVMSRNSHPVSIGAGAACLGHPLNAVLWLARKMAELGRPIGAGDIILSGALGPVVPVHPGDVFSVEIQGFQPLNIEFSA